MLNSETIYSYLVLGSDLVNLRRKLFHRSRNPHIKYPEVEVLKLKQELMFLFDLDINSLEEIKPNHIPYEITSFIKSKTKEVIFSLLVLLGYCLHFWWKKELSNENLSKIEKVLNQTIEKLNSEIFELEEPISDFLNKKKNVRSVKAIDSFFSELSDVIYSKIEEIEIKEIKEISPTITKVLFISADPKNSKIIRILEECKIIKKELESDINEKFYFNPEYLVTADELTGYISRFQPKIVHFSVRGSNVKRIKIPINDEEEISIEPELLGNIFDVFKEFVQCVILNGCYTDDYAKAIGQYIKCVVGTKGIDKKADEVSLKFAQGFYRGIGRVGNIGSALKLGEIQVELLNIKSKNIGEIYTRDNKDPNQIMLI